jgi:hypothetical protein
MEAFCIRSVSSCQHSLLWCGGLLTKLHQLAVGMVLNRAT